MDVCLETPATGVVHLPDKNATVHLTRWSTGSRIQIFDSNAISGTLDIARWQKSPDNNATTGDVTLTDVTFADGLVVSTGRVAFP
jgi:hypothetical protein